MASTLCMHCGWKPRAREGTKIHDYCSKSCASAAINSPNFVAVTHKNNGWLQGLLASSTSSSSKAPGTCLLGGCSQAVYVGPTGKSSQYCSRLHMNQSMTTPSVTPAAAAGPSNAPQPFGGPANMAVAAAPNPGICLLPGCGKPVWIDGTGAWSQYCGKGHQAQAASQAPVGGALLGAGVGGGAGACLWCHAAPQYANSPFCGHNCTQKAEAASPGILVIPPTHPRFQSVATQFETKWKGGVPRKAKHIYLVLVKTSNMKKFHAYRDAIEKKRQIAQSGRPAGNQQRRWHGTRRMCNIGDPGQTNLCGSSSCPLCSIIRSSFSMKFASSGLFGKGIYTSSTSSKSDGYSSNGASSPLKAMLLNKVIVGRGHKVPNFQSFSSPPSGYDSILGELANDECIVYTEDAIRPAYLVMY